jgi:hypothetical protein
MSINAAPRPAEEEDVAELTGTAAGLTAALEVSFLLFPCLVQYDS